MDRGRATAWALALAGLIPFVGCAAMVALGGPGADAWLGALGFDAAEQRQLRDLLTEPVSR